METINNLSETPSIGNSLSFGWKKMFEQFLPLLILIIICAIFQGPVKFTSGDWHFTFWNLLLLPLGLAYGFLFWPVINYSADFLFVKAIRSQKVELMELIESFRNKYIHIIIANLLTVALIVLGLIMLIIPGIIVACRLVFVSYLVMDKNLEPMEAIEQSWKMTGGHSWTIFFMGFLSIFIALAGLIMFIVGVFISAMWISAAFAALYQSILNQNQANETIPILAVEYR